MAFDRIEDALRAMARGEMVVVVDNEDRENEGDIILAAEHATPEAVAFMVRHTSGMLCVALPGERLDRLDLPLMVERNTETLRTAYTVTVDFRHGTSTGISAADRAATIRALVDPSAYRRRQVFVKKESEARLPTRHGVFKACVYREPDSIHEHLAMVMGEVQGEENVLVRVHAISGWPLMLSTRERKTHGSL